MELVVSIGIITLILAVVFANYRDYESAVILQNLAYEVALSVRDAQLRSISVTSDIEGSSKAFQRAWGIQFRENKGTYNLFYDKGNEENFKMDGGETVSTYVIGRGVTVNSIRVKTDDVWQDVITLDLSFLRPHLESIYRTPLADSIDDTITETEITLTSPKNASYIIHINKTGRIIVKQP